MTAEMASNIKVRLKKPYHLPSAGHHNAMTASLECCSLMGNCLYAASWSTLKKIQSRWPWLRRREISTRRSQGASFIWVSTTQARFVKAWRRSSQALSLLICSTPKRKATLSLGSVKVEGDPPEVKGKGVW